MAHEAAGAQLDLTATAEGVARELFRLQSKASELKAKWSGLRPRHRRKLDYLRARLVRAEQVLCRENTHSIYAEDPGAGHLERVAKAPLDVDLEEIVRDVLEKLAQLDRVVPRMRTRPIDVDDQHKMNDLQALLGRTEKSIRLAQVALFTRAHGKEFASDVYDDAMTDMWCPDIAETQAPFRQWCRDGDWVQRARRSLMGLDDFMNGVGFESWHSVDTVMRASFAGAIADNFVYADCGSLTRWDLANHTPLVLMLAEQFRFFAEYFAGLVDCETIHLFDGPRTPCDTPDRALPVYHAIADAELRRFPEKTIKKRPWYD